MKMLGKAILLASLASAAAQETGRFQPRSAASYPARQRIENLTIAVEPYESGGKVKQAFGKINFAKLGVLPILVVMANDSDRVLQLEGMRVEFITADGQRIEPIPAEDVERSGRVHPGDIGRRPSPIPGGGVGTRGPRPASWELGAREFAARMLPARGTANGFFYFRLGRRPDRIPGSKLYVTGIRDARTGQELFYFEISLDEYV
ncbi:MAG: hypothetical protein HY236_05050, partial [Acidobacteria bacterium]|nr:hypothetical protein [Acidobacteriota bacterium]